MWLLPIESGDKNLSALGSVGFTKTDFDGNFSFKCPAEACLVYSSGQVGRTSSQWIEILTAGKRDLSGSNGFTVNIPDSL